MSKRQLSMPLVLGAVVFMGASLQAAAQKGTFGSLPPDRYVTVLKTASEADQISQVNQLTQGLQQQVDAVRPQGSIDPQGALNALKSMDATLLHAAQSSDGSSPQRPEFPSSTLTRAQIESSAVPAFPLAGSETVAVTPPPIDSSAIGSQDSIALAFLAVQNYQDSQKPKPSPTPGPRPQGNVRLINTFVVNPVGK